jgi:transposase InsO family protein
LQKHGLTGSMGRRGNPYDNAKAESFMKTLKVEAVYLMAYETLRYNFFLFEQSVTYITDSLSFFA